MLIRGMLVELPEDRGIGKLVSATSERSVVSIFHSVRRTDHIEICTSDLRRGFLSRQTRVYIVADEGSRIGRVIGYFKRSDGILEYEVRFPNGRVISLDETCLHVRPWNAPDDPAEILAAGGAESQYLHDRRHAAILRLTEMRGAAQGMSALLSSGVEFVSHQIAAVRRVLADPVQRYLLADEVGLGKTIEAGLIARQHLIDDHRTRVVISVPSHLLSQWRAELSEKLHFKQFEGSYEIVSHEEFASFSGGADVLIVDEAHHLVGTVGGPLAEGARKLREMAASVKVFLLLSATPALSDPVRFLALLNLLDPSSHPLDDPAGFALKLENRKNFGRLLLSLDATAPTLVVRQRALEAMKLFPEDHVVQNIAPQLVEATKANPDLVLGLCNTLRSHIADTYRIHQRLVRSRRAEAKGWEFMPRGPSGPGGLEFSHVRHEVDSDELMSRLLAVLEEWRFAALESVGTEDDRRLEQIACRYMQWLAALSVGVSEFQSMLASSPASFPEEARFIEELAHLVEGTGRDEDRAITMAESAARLIRTLSASVSSPKVVAFATSHASAARFADALEKSAHDFELIRFGDVPNRLNETDPINRFRSTKRPALLVVDGRGEEGLNLNFADGIVHLDMPMSAARVEQRIGRLDRFGRRQNIIRHRVHLPSDDDGSPWQEWLTVLSEGLSIFHRSISDVQFLLDGIEKSFFVRLVRDGAGAANAAVAEIREILADERRAQDEQSALDRIAMTDTATDDLIEKMEVAEQDERALGKDIEGWTLDALQFRKFKTRRHRDGQFSLTWDSSTLVPIVPWLRSFDASDDVPVSWQRRNAAGGGATLLRPGSPFIDAVERYTRWDDRGTAFATWRVEPDWKDEPWFGFRICFISEADIDVENLTAPTVEERALMRRAQTYLPPFATVLHVNAEGAPVEDTDLLRILSRRYESSGDDARIDINLGSRPGILADFIDAASFAQVCRSVAASGTAAVQSQPDYLNRIASARSSAASDRDRRRASDMRRSAYGNEHRTDESAIAEKIFVSVSNPRVRVDSIGCFIVSNARP